MRKLHLTKGKFALVDNEDYKRLSPFKWYVSEAPSNKLYAASSKLGLLSRFLINVPEGMEADHINGDSLDNRKSNLRIVTHAQNMLNKKLYKNKVRNKGSYI